MCNGRLIFQSKKHIGFYILYNVSTVQIRLRQIPAPFLGACVRQFNQEFDVHVTVHRDNFLIIQAIRCTNFSKFYFWNETLHVSDRSSVRHQEFFTVHTAMVHVIQVCRQLAIRIRIGTEFHPDIRVYHCSVYSEKLLTMDRGTIRNMQSFIPKIKF